MARLPSSHARSNHQRIGSSSKSTSWPARLPWDVARKARAMELALGNWLFNNDAANTPSSVSVTTTTTSATSSSATQTESYQNLEIRQQRAAAAPAVPAATRISIPPSTTTIISIPPSTVAKAASVAPAPAPEVTSVSTTSPGTDGGGTSTFQGLGPNGISTFTGIQSDSTATEIPSTLIVAMTGAPPTPPVQTAAATKSTSSKLTPYLIAAGSVGGFVISILVIYLVLKCRKRTKGGRPRSSQGRDPREPTPPPDFNDMMSYGGSKNGQETDSYRSQSVSTASPQFSQESRFAPPPLKVARSSFIGRERGDLVRATINRHPLATLNEHSFFRSDGNNGSQTNMSNFSERSNLNEKSPEMNNKPRKPSLAQQISNGANRPPVPPVPRPNTNPNSRGSPANSRGSPAASRGVSPATSRGVSPGNSRGISPMTSRGASPGNSRGSPASRSPAISIADEMGIGLGVLPLNPHHNPDPDAPSYMQTRSATRRPSPPGRRASWKELSALSFNSQPEQIKVDGVPGAPPSSIRESVATTSAQTMLDSRVSVATSAASVPRFRSVHGWVDYQTHRVERKGSEPHDTPTVPPIADGAEIGLASDGSDDGLRLNSNTSSIVTVRPWNVAAHTNSPVDHNDRNPTTTPTRRSSWETEREPRTPHRADDEDIFADAMEHYPVTPVPILPRSVPAPTSAPTLAVPAAAPIPAPHPIFGYGGDGKPTPVGPSTYNNHNNTGNSSRPTHPPLASTNNEIAPFNHQRDPSRARATDVRRMDSTSTATVFRFHPGEEVRIGETTRVDSVLLDESMGVGRKISSASRGLGGM